MLRGKIDRVDTASRPKRVRVVDYKTGKLTEDEDELFAGGRALQLPIYNLARAPRPARGHRAEEAVYYHATCAGKLAEGAAPATPEIRGDLGRVLADSTRWPRRHLPPQPDETPVDYCDFQDHLRPASASTAPLARRTTRGFAAGGLRAGAAVSASGRCPPTRRPRPGHPRLRHHHPAGGRRRHGQDLGAGGAPGGAGAHGAGHARPRGGHHLHREGRGRAEAAPEGRDRGGQLESAVPEVERERLVQRGRATWSARPSPRSTPSARACCGNGRSRPASTPRFTVAAEVKGERTLNDALDTWIDARMRAGDPVLVRALHLELKLDALRTAARSMVSQRDILARAECTGQPSTPTACWAGCRGALARLWAAEGPVPRPTDGAFESILELETSTSRCHGAPDRHRPGGSLLRGLEVNHKNGRPGPGGRRGLRPGEGRAEGAVKDAVKAYLEASNAHLAWELRHLLRGFGQRPTRTPSERRPGRLPGPAAAHPGRPAALPAGAALLPGRFDFLLVDEFQDTDPLQVEIAFLLGEDQAGAGRRRLAAGAAEAGQAVHGGRPEAVDLPLPARRPGQSTRRPRQSPRPAAARCWRHRQLPHRRRRSPSSTSASARSSPTRATRSRSR